MVEIVFCRVTRRGRKKKAGMNKLARENCRNDGPMGGGFIPPDTLKITLDLSDSGPVFSALDDMMMKMMEDDEKARSGGKGDNSAAKNALKKLLKSGIPGIEAMFGAEDPTPKFGKKGAGKKGFHKMTDASKKKFMNAIFGEEGTQIDSSTAAALLAATCSGGNADIGNKLAELLMPELDEKVDPAMMAALMAACSVIQTGANTEEVLNIMKLELAASGLSEEEILEKAKLLMRAFGKEEAGSTAEFMLMSKQTNAALVKAGLPPKDFTSIVLAQKALAACGTSSENVAKILMVFSVLGKKGANPQHVAGSMKNLGAMSDEAKADCKEKILKSWGNGKFGKSDVQGTVRMHQALDNENEPGWAEVKNLKDIVGGVSPTSPEAIELNLARAIKAGGLKKDDIGRALIALKAVAALGIDPVKLSKIIFLEKTICESGVPASEVARVLNDGLMPPEAIQGLVSTVAPKLDEDGCKSADVDASVALYNNLKFKSNIPTEIIEFVDKTLIQVRCSLEDVADNMISSLCARGEKTARIIGQVTETLKNTGATAHVVATTLMPPLVEMTGESEASLIRTISRNLKEVEYEPEDVKSAITELVLKILDNDMTQYVDAVKALEDSLKDMGMFANEIQEYVKANIPSPPTPPEEIERRAQMAAELARLEAEEVERERLKALKEADPGAYDKEMRIKLAELKEGDPAAYEAEMKKLGKGELDRLLSKSDSRRGSLLPGQTRSRAGSIVIGTGSRRGSCTSTNTNRATVAMVTDDPEHKSAMREGLAGAFGDEESAHSAANGFANGFASAAGGGGAAAGGSAGVAAGVAAAAAAAGVDTATQQKLQKLAQSDPVAYEKEMKKLGAAALANVDPATQERMAKLKESDPAAYEKELKKLGAAVAAGAPGVGGAAGAAGAGGAGGAGGVGAGAGGAAAGIAGAAAVAGVDKATKDKLQKMKESDPAAYEAELKKIGLKAVANLDKATQERLAKLKASDPAAYEKELKKLGSVAASGGQPAGGKVGQQQVASNGLSNGSSLGAGAGGSLPAGTKVEAGADGRVTLGGAKLPQGAAVVNNPDGSKSISVTAEQEELVAKMLASGMDEATAYQYLQQLCGVAGKGKTLCNVGGAVSFRTAEESVENAKEILNAFDRAILKHKNRPKIEVPPLTPEAKALMEQILASNGSKEEIASRVEALLAGSELSSSRGMNGGFDGNKREHIPVSGPSRKAYIMLDESYEATVPNAGSSAPRRQGSWREKEVQRRKNHNLGLAQHLGRRRQSWMSEAEELLRLQYRASLDRIMKLSIYDNKSAYDIQFMVNEFMFNSANLSEARSGKIPQLDEDSLARPGQQGSLADRIRARNAAKGARGSVKRQSEIQREKKKSRQEEREEEKARKASYYRKVTGLRRAKVPMMVYSCGGFSRCFRVCRFYDVEGPPVGVEYEAPTPLKETRNL